MRLTPEVIRAAILDPNSLVRREAVAYFTGSFSTDPTVMPLVTRAIDQYGREELDDLPLYNLKQSEETLQWLIQQLGAVDCTRESDAEYCEGLEDAILTCEPELLARHRDALVQALGELGMPAVDFRIEAFGRDAASLWDALGERSEIDGELFQEPEDEFHFQSLADALAKSPDIAADILKILDEADLDEVPTWAELAAIRLAGWLRLEQAVPKLLEYAQGDGELAWGANHALVRIGSDSVVELLESGYSDLDEDLQLLAIDLLARIHTDHSVQTTQRLLERETSRELRGRLCAALMRNFASEGIEFARQWVLASDKDFDMVETRQMLLACSLLAQQPFPERDAWLEDAKGDAKFLAAWLEQQGAEDDGGWDAFDHELDGDLFYADGEEAPFERGMFGDEIDDEESDGEDGDQGEDDDDEDDDEDGPRQRRSADESSEEPREKVKPFEYANPRVGRNDPCPCGSGKKYKKCCHGKADAAQSQRWSTDDQPPAAEVPPPS